MLARIIASFGSFPTSINVFHLNIEMTRFEISLREEGGRLLRGFLYPKRSRPCFRFLDRTRIPL